MTDLFSRSPTAVPKPLRPYQERALELLRATILSGRRRPILALPTGAGKTRLAAEIIRGALAQSRTVIFIVPRLSLIEQAVRDFEAEGIFDIGVKQGRHHRTDSAAAVQIASAQTLARRDDRPRSDIVIVDECHIQHQHLIDWIENPEFKETLFIGLSATPWSRGLGRTYDALLQPISIAELIETDFLSRLRVFAPEGPDLGDVRLTAGEYNEGDLSKACDKKELTANIVETWKRRAAGFPTLCYGVDRRHAQHLQERFIEAGIVAEYLDCETPLFDREDVFDRFRAGRTRIICNVATLDTGINLPDVRCIIDARPTRSRIRFVQTIGRGLRPAPGKERLLVLDHAGNTARLGLVTEIGCNCLDKGEERGKAYDRAKGSEPVIITCKQCDCVLPRRARECPACGEPIFATTEVIEKDGELVELGATRARRERGPDIDQALWFGALTRIGRERGYKRGWPAAMFKARFGRWPPRNFLPSEREPTVEIRNWVRSRQIAFAKARARA
ncbi:MAG: DEAD/DEAH box helicase [Pseudomonadota bacterium]